MTISIFEVALSFDKNGTDPEKFIEHLNNIAKVERDDAMEGLFKPIVGLYPPPEVKAIIMYIAYAYSEKSDACISGVSTSNMKRSIASLVQLPEYLYTDVVYLQKKEVRTVIVDYLDYQGDRDWAHYQNKLIQYNALTSVSVKDMMNDDGKVDFKTLRDTNAMSNDLLSDIKRYEEEYKSRYGFVIDNKKEIEKIAEEGDKGVRSLSVESSKEVSQKALRL